MAEEQLYTDFAAFLRRFFPFKVQKISINAGFTCPNRDGSKGVGGCTYCNNQTFNPDYCKPSKGIAAQIEEGKRFFARKYPHTKYLAYFQAYTNTYADIDTLRDMYNEALAQPDVVGIIIGTRPDCMPDTLLDYLESLSRTHFVMVEYGVETSHDSTLKTINRGHSWAESVEAIRRTHARGIPVGAHLILGLPGETTEDMVETARRVAQLPLDTIKIHQLQLIRGTRLAKQVADGSLSVINWTVEEYIKMCARWVEIIPSTIAIERFVSQSPSHLLISPKWGLKNYEFTHLLHNRLKKSRELRRERD